MNRSVSPATGLSWYSSTYGTGATWTDYMASATQTGCGPSGVITAPNGTLVTTWGLRRVIENTSGYGWTFESGTSSLTTPTVVAEVRSSDGAARFGGGLYNNAGRPILGQTGSVIQTVYASYTAQWSATPGAYPGVSTGLTITITPQTTSSKILLMGTMYASVSEAVYVCDFYISRNGTAVGVGASFSYDSASPGFYVNGGTDHPWITLPIMIYDTPGTTSAVTYTIYAQSGNGGTVYLNRRVDSWSAGPTQLIAMEIAQ
jgi:hypothetical protein